VVAPAQISPVPKGRATLEVGFVSGASAVTAAFATNPLKLLTPRARGESVWACTSSFGGGLVAGDETRLDLHLRPNARCYLGTQASTKVYRNPSCRPCGHVTHATLDENSLLVFAPDPVQAFANSSYTQRQEFHLAPGAGLVLADWFSSGRAARGERWAFAHFQSRNDVFISEGRAFVDSLRLSSEDGSLLSPHRTGWFNCLATLLFIGAPLREFAEHLLATINSRPVERQAPLVTSASPIRDGALLRVAGESVELVGRELHHHLQPVTALLGDDPWARKW
jgi:urease accessory protein